MIEKMLERLRKLLSNVNFEKATQEVNESYFDGMAYAYGDAIKIMQEAAKDGGWIHCSERLPSENERWSGHDITDAEPREFIVMVKGAYEPTTGYYTNNGWVKDICNKEESGYADEIIAWRFFPAPYQKGE